MMGYNFCICQGTPLCCCCLSPLSPHSAVRQFLKGILYVILPGRPVCLPWDLIFVVKKKADPSCLLTCCLSDLSFYAGKVLLVYITSDRRMCELQTWKCKELYRLTGTWMILRTKPSFMPEMVLKVALNQAVQLPIFL